MTFGKFRWAVRRASSAVASSASAAFTCSLTTPAASIRAGAVEGGSAPQVQGGNALRRRIAIVTAAAGVAAALVAPAVAFAGSTATSAAGASVCVHAHVNLNGTEQGIDQCLP